MQTGASTLSLAASGLYALIVIVLCAAVFCAKNNMQQDWHWRGWLVLAVFFAALAALRIFDIEELLRDEVRSIMRSQHAYGERRSFQRPIVAIALTLVAAAGFWWFYKTARLVSGRRNIALMVGIGSAGGLAALVTFRIISLGPVDALLYGPLKLNWFGDIGLTVLVGASAAYYIKVVTSSRQSGASGR